MYRAWVKGADPRSDLAVLAIDAAGPDAHRPGRRRRRCARGRFVVTLGNPYAIARDGQASAGWGIVANLARKAPPSPEDSDPSAQADLAPFRHAHPDRCQAEHRHQRRAAVEPQGRDGRPVRRLGGGRRLRDLGRLRHSRRCHLPPRAGHAQGRPRGGIRVPGHPAGQLAAAARSWPACTACGWSRSCPARPPLASA